MNQPQPMATAWFAGRDAYHAGRPETANPYIGALAPHWSQGWRKARKRARFDATIAAKRTAKTLAKAKA